ncbi:MAG TPA: hypothetical protein VGA40_05545, partial [Candidatus Acidoferrales bacterium]
MRRMFLFLILLLAAATCAAQAPTLYQKPTVNATHIVFAYAGDLWSVPRAGGDARQLTTGTGAESDPKFSPDGAMIAFTGEYDGNVDAFVIPAEGGIPRRLTYHPGNDNVVGWTPDSKNVLFRSTRSSFTFGVNRLFTIPVAGGAAAEVPLPSAFEGSFSPDGKRLAYQPLSQWQPEWKRYRGGQTARIWLADLADSSVVTVPRENSNDFAPMWVGDTVYFLSDRDGATTLYSYSLSNRRVTRVLNNERLDIKSASAGGDAIVYERFGTIHIYDLKTRRSQPVTIRMAGDFASVRPRFERAAGRATNAQISPTGARAVFEVRGEIVTVPAAKGDPRNLTNTPGVMERYPSWSPDGKWIAYFSEESGEYALHLRDQTAKGEVRKISLGNPPSFFFSPVWSPDNKKIAYTDKRGMMWYVEIEKGAPVRIDAHHYVLFAPQMNPAWSPDSRWIAYTRILTNRLSAVFVFSLETGKSTQITDGMSDASFPVFDKKGELLFFLASTDAGPSLTGGDMSQIAYRTTSSVYLAVLRSDRPSPFAPESDEEKIAPDKADEKKEEAKPAAPPAASKEPEPVRIDFDGITQRTIALPIPARAYTTLQAGKAGFIYLMETVPPPANAPPGQPFGQTLHKYDLAKRSFDRV